MLREPVFLLLTVLDTVLALIWRASRPPAPPVSRRAARLATRRDRTARRGTALVAWRLRAAIAWTWQAQFPELPGPVGRAVSLAGPPSPGIAVIAQ